MSDRGEIEIAGVEALCIGVEYEAKSIGVLVEESDSGAFVGVVFKQRSIAYSAALGGDVDFEHIVLQSHHLILADEALGKFAAACVGVHSILKRLDGAIAQLDVGVGENGVEIHIFTVYTYSTGDFVTVVAKARLIAFEDVCGGTVFSHFAATVELD